MLQILMLLILVLAFMVPLLLTVWWPGRRWRFGIVLIGTMLSGWGLIVSGALLHKYAHDAQLYERASSGLPVTQGEYMEDGVGENAAALLLGWIVPTLGAGIGGVITAAGVGSSRPNASQAVAVEPDDSAAAA
jgi:hypothetical protein